MSFNLAKKMVLTPAQNRVLDELSEAAAFHGVVIFKSDPGIGRTTILRALHARLHGAFLGTRQFLRALTARRPDALEESFLDLIEDSLDKNPVVIVDDMHLLNEVVDGVYYPRPELLNLALKAIAEQASAMGRTLILGWDDGRTPGPIGRPSFFVRFTKLDAEDYRVICRAHLPRVSAARLEYDKIHRFAPMLHAYQLKHACERLRDEKGLNTDRLVEYLADRNLTSNVNESEVQAVDWKDLKGMDDLIEALEAKVALPFENSSLAAELKLKPKRGVLLAGPPGTGKTTIGRALAHRLKGKFFLIDGTVVAGSSDFEDKVNEIFQAAKNNAPSVVFIDDADVIFEGNGDRGFYRYLLTIMDGLESASAERVCVMMTAMDPGSLPPAILRSGRIELWLETRLPGLDARVAIVKERLDVLSCPLRSTDVLAIASSSKGLTGADLKAVIEDGKLRYAYDSAKGNQIRPSEEYFLDAIARVRDNHRTYQRRRKSGLAESRFGFLADC